MKLFDLKEITPPVNLAHCRAYLMNGCSIFVGREPMKKNGIVRDCWHLSIAHRKRYPTWDEIKTARYQLLPHDVTMAMILPPTNEYVNIHNNCFHLYEIENFEGA